MIPGELRGRRVGLDETVEVHVVALFDAVRIDRVAQPERNDWRD